MQALRDIRFWEAAMRTGSRFAIIAGMIWAVQGFVPPALAQNALVLSMKQTDCLELFATDPVVKEMAVPNLSGGSAEGFASDGLLGVHVTITRGTKTEPTLLDWQSASAGAGLSPVLVRAVLVQHGDGNTRAYIYPKGAYFDHGLTGPLQSRSAILKTRFCYGGTTPPLVSLAPCPLSDVPGAGETESPLQRACNALAPAAYFQFVFPRGSDLGPADGVGPAFCVCPSTPDRTITSRQCNISDRTAPNACFPEGTPTQPARKAFATNVDEFVRASGSVCAVHCSTVDGMRFCTEFCLPQ